MSLERSLPDSFHPSSLSTFDPKLVSPVLKHLFAYRMAQIRLLHTRHEIINGARLEQITRLKNIRPAVEIFELLFKIDIDPRLKTWYSFQRYDHEFGCFAVAQALENYPSEGQEYLREAIQLGQRSGAPLGWSFPSKLIGEGNVERH